jgi:hypothetical protein
MDVQSVAHHLKVHVIEFLAACGTDGDSGFDRHEGRMIMGRIIEIRFPSPEKEIILPSIILPN